MAHLSCFIPLGSEAFTGLSFDFFSLPKPYSNSVLSVLFTCLTSPPVSSASSSPLLSTSDTTLELSLHLPFGHIPLPPPVCGIL